MLFSACACSPSGTTLPTLTPTPEKSQSPTPTPKTDLTVNDYVIVFPDVDVSANFALREAAITLRTAIGTVANVKCRMSSDKLDEEQGFFENTYEILIGNTNRTESSVADGYNLRYYDYIIKSEGTKVVIGGGSDEAVANAVEYFITDIASADLATVEGCKKLTQTDIHYVFDSNIERMYINGRYITNFKVISSLDDDTVNGIINDILMNAGEKITRGDVDTVTDFEIIIGECDRDEYRQVYDNLGKLDYAVECVNGKLVIAGKNTRCLNLAIEKFREDCLGMKNKTLDVTPDTDYRYEYNYPVKSVTLCGYDISEYVIATSTNNIGVAKKLSNKIEEMTGKGLKIVTDSADLYDKAIVLSKSGNERANTLLKSIADDKIMIISEGSKIYIGTNNISYGDSPAVNAFIRDILGYDTALGKADSDTVNAESLNFTPYILDNVEDFVITQYFGIRQKFILNEDGSLNTQRLDENKEAGMNLIVVQFDSETNKKVLEYCAKIGIRCTVYDHRINNVLYSEQLPENWEEQIKAVVDDYKDYPSMYYYGICDEPGEDRFERIRMITQYLEELDPARRQYVNHFPQESENMYDKFMKEVGTEILSYDRYVFRETEDGKPEDTPEIFYMNLEYARNVGLKYEVDYMAILLLTEHYATSYTRKYRYLTKEDLSWQAYTALAYGVSEVSYFTYWTPAPEEDSQFIYSEGMISADGKKNQHYYDVQDIMKRFTVIANALVDKISLGIFHTKEYAHNDRTTTPFTEYGTIKQIIADDVTVGMFEDDMMLIANGSYKESMDVEIVTDSKLMVLDTETGEWNEVKDNKITIATGSGELIKIVK